jgi:lipoyl(octanoyl) transferase
MSSHRDIQVREWGLVDYTATFDAMRRFTDARVADQADELWVCEHHPVFTQGLAGKPEHLLKDTGVPIVQSNRGGQVTYHGPGQVVVYPLIDLKRAGYYVKEYVYKLEEAVIRTLADWQVTGLRVPSAPGIYVRPGDPSDHRSWSNTHTSADPFVGLAKISALGIKVSRHCTYHGVALNVSMDLSPFTAINPCGYAGLQTVDLRTIGIQAPIEGVSHALVSHLAHLL